MLKIKVGNGVWWGVLACTVLGTWGLHTALRGCSADQTRMILFVMGCVTMALYIIQRLFMFRDPAFLQEYGSRWQDLLVQLLPLHLCYAGLILTIFGLYFNVEYIMAFSFYIGMLGAFFAILAPDSFDQNKSILNPPIFFFYFLHMMLICLYCNIGFAGLFAFSWKMGANSVLIALVMATVIHFVNLLGHRLDMPTMNYFYTTDPAGSGILELLWKWIPCRFFYIVLPAAVAFFAWTMLLTAAAKLLIK